MSDKIKNVINDDRFKDFVSFFKKYNLIIFIIIFSIIKHLLVTQLPVSALPDQLYDDNMMFEMAQNIREGHWLGQYDSNTLVKGAFFPLLLATINYFGLSYLGVMDLIYTISCIFFIYAIKDIFKSKKPLYFIFLLLLFNPLSYSWWTFQRVYRNGITMAQVLIIIGSLFKMYECRFGSKFKMFIYSLIGGLTFGTLYHTREDGMWIEPFILAVIILVLISLIKKYRRKDKKELFKRVIISLLPIIILYGSIQAVRLVNYKVYGVYSYNELNDGYFGKSLQTIYSIKTNENIDKVAVTREKIRRIYEISPTLSSIKPQLEASLEAWGVDKGTDEKQVENGLFWWAYKQAVQDAGYYENATKSNEFYKKVTDEIDKAVKEGKIDSQFKMPATLLSPWKNEYLGKEFTTIGEMIGFTTTYDQISIALIPNSSAQVTDEQIREYEVFTNDFAFYKDKYRCLLDGFYVPKNYDVFSLEVQDESGNIMSKLKLQGSEDIYSVLKTRGQEVEQSKNCRFHLSLDLDQKYNKLYFVALDKNSNIIEKIELNNEEKLRALDTDDSFYIFSADLDDVRDPKYEQSLGTYRVLKNIQSMYINTGMVLAIVAIAIYILMIIYFLIMDNKNNNLFNLLLLLTGILCTYLVLIAGISYNHISTTNSKLYMYLSGAYPLQIAFIIISITAFLENIKEFFYKIRNKMKK